MSRCKIMSAERMKAFNRIAAYAAVSECNEADPPIPVCEMFYRSKRNRKRQHTEAFERLVERLRCAYRYAYTEIATVMGCDHSAVLYACRRVRGRVVAATDPTPEEIEQAKAELRDV